MSSGWATLAINSEICIILQALINQSYYLLKSAIKKHKIQARRQLANGNWSAVEMLVLPLLRQPDTFEFSLIQITANRVDYVEGEVMEARIEPPAGNFTYAVNGINRFSIIFLMDSYDMPYL
jgi:hypothetical protein